MRQAELEKRLDELAAARAEAEARGAEVARLSSALAAHEQSLGAKERDLAAAYTAERARLAAAHEAVLRKCAGLETDKREALHELSTATAQVGRGGAEATAQRQRPPSFQPCR